jgi:dihydroflavonol-4-reductase
MRALITGASGLVGANLVRELLKAGYAVRALVRAGSDLRALQGVNVEKIHGDVLHLDSLISAARDCDVVFHTAAMFTYWGMSGEELEQLAVQGTTNVIEAAHLSGVSRVVFTSSSVVCGSSARPLVRNESDFLDEQDNAPYVLAKELQERVAFQHADEFGVELVAVCPTMSVGPHGYRLGPSNGLIVAYLSDVFKATFPGGCNIISIKDIAKGHILAAVKGATGERYLLGSENLRWSDIHKIISELCGVPGPYWQANHTVSFLAATADEFFSKFRNKPPLTTRTQARMVGRYYWYEHKKAAAIGFKPRPARQALADAIGWLTASEHISRQIRIGLKLSREVYQAKKAMEADEAIIRGYA